MINHLWQSTLFAVVAGLLTLAFRSNRAQVRYWLWFSASVKFFIPLALLMSLGSRFERPANTIATPAVSLAIEEVAEPFPEAVSFAPAAPGTRDWTPIAFFAVWACGFLAIALIRFRGWRRIRAAVRASLPMDIAASVEVRSSPGLLEPGVVGWLHPILLVPEGIAERLTPRQLEAVLAHELCHVRRRDNATSAVHMVVEAVFWFHPLVWWIGARLVEERERACDEGVLSLGNEPQIYAEAILNVCKLYVESPLACVSGVTGADLKKRIEAIIVNRIALRLNLAKKVALAVAGIAVVVVPVAVGMMNTKPLGAQPQPQVVAAPAVEPPPVILQTPEKQRAPPAPPRVEANSVDPKTYVIGPQDVLSIAVFHEPDLTRVGTVRDDGKIVMPLIGDIQAAGLTPVRFGAQLKEALSAYINNIDVTITIMQVNSKRSAAAELLAKIEDPVPLQATLVFEAASIRLCGSADAGGKEGGARGGGGPGEQGPSPDRLRINCQSLRNIIRTAYVVYPDGNRVMPGRTAPLEGGPGWIDSERYQIVAKAEGAPGQNMMHGPMLQRLLEDRFKVKVHRESREVPAYALTVAKNGPKLQPFKEGSCTVLDFSKPLPIPPPDAFCAMAMRRRKASAVDWNVKGSTLDDFAMALGGDLDRIVINKTGIAGTFDFHLEFAPDESTRGLNNLRVGGGEPAFPQPTASDPPGGPSIFTAIQEQLGLKLESSKGPREFVVIDRAEKPSEN
ncbi:MAG TPA: TIGR03435 family protein [Bryobacteraceae bacterium]|jgi:uncharacterized protein (TIGR03435 family)|nr:TIGR03435 family protein [Bryobacteraceae bacterium]